MQYNKEDEALTDIDEFIKEAEKFINSDSQKQHGTVGGIRPPDDCDDAIVDIFGNPIKPGKLTQYSLYGEGYVPGSATIKTLPPGCYDILADQKCVYAVPAIKPSGLLLELPEMRSDYVIQLVETFWNSEKDYKEGNEFVIGGAAYRAGVLLFGPPGSGKSSTIKIVSKKLIERGGIIFHSPYDPSIVTAFLNDFSKIEPNRKCIVILEDIDSLIQNFGESRYLEMLDSAKTINNVLFIATTNYPERLDPRIYNRPGRFSHVVKIGLPTAVAREAYLKAILKDHRDVQEIVEGSEGLTIDHLTALVNLIYRQKKNLKEELARLRKLFVVPKSNDAKPIGFGRSEEWDG